ncbi:MAG: lipid A export permease/ATP-binding protein MsbA [Halioglobus sp.]|nr:lipid A export permease/ATP-binding protein MsbA [Halioglobus sp.]
MDKPVHLAGATHVTDLALYRRLLRYVAPYWYFLALSLLGFGVYSLGVVLLADLMQFLLDALGEPAEAAVGILSGVVYGLFTVASAERAEFARVVVPLALVGLTVFRGLGFFGGSYFVSLVARNLVHDLRCELFGKLLSMPASFYDGNDLGGLVSRITYNVDQVTGAVTKALKTVLREGLVVIGLVGYMLYINWTLCLVFLAVAPVIARVVTMVGRHFRRYSRRIQSSMGEVTQVSAETLGAIEALRMFGGEARGQARFAAASECNREQTLKLAFVESLSTPTLQVLLSLALAALMWFALSPTVLVGFSAGSLVAFLVAAVQLGKPLRQLSGVQSILQRGLAALEDIFQQLDAEAERDTGVHAIARARGRLSIRELSFRYPGAAGEALKSVSLEIGAGETVALVGPSGSGKTTLTRLLTRAYDPPVGSIFLDDLPIEDYRLSALRAQFAQVSQHPALFRDSIYNNIAFGDLNDASDGAVRAAASAAGCDEFLRSLPQGLHTLLADNGNGLSGGQRQCIALARAILKDAPIMLLDEATSALDPQTEYNLQKALDAITRDRTTLVIAHRMSTVENADRIIVLERGRIVASGSHLELITQPGLYRRLHAREFAD